MSYGSLGDGRSKALSIGNAGLRFRMITAKVGCRSIICRAGQILYGRLAGLFGARDQAGNFNPELFRKQAAHEQVKAIEIKLAQGAKQRGGHVDGAKVTEKIASIRNVEPWKTIDSPNRFKGIETTEKLMSFLEELRRLSNKPVGIKITLGSKQHAASWRRN
ncbi:glutamate synthase-related protein [Marinococcus halophilus]|uniref:glutamate synthase-related protein n=1 Tax=Marinococcus halophilus TaxID=1371 RepID=UPI00361342EB